MKKLIAFFFAAAALFAAAAEKTSIENLYRYRLTNGLEVFVAEDHKMPTVYINVAVRAGGVAQTAQTAGLFHLYEHMMFKGNSLYPDAHKMEIEMKKLGVIEHNGYTSTDEVNYFFTIPSDKVEEGLAFWNAAIRSPLLDEEELEIEKKVVLAEIEGDAAEKKSWAREYLNTTLFPKTPYKQDAGGSFDVVRNATVEDLRKMQEEYYIPNNAALFIAGDVNAEEVMPLVRDIFGSWDAHGIVPKEKFVARAKSTLEEPAIAVFPTDSASNDFTQLEVHFRAPDTDFDFAETAAADYLSILLDMYGVPFKKTFNKDKRLSFFSGSDERVSSAFYAGRQSSEFVFTAYLDKYGAEILDDAIYFKDKITDEILPKIADSKKYFTPWFAEWVLDHAESTYVPTAKASKEILDVIEQFWVLGSADSYFNYDDMLYNVSQRDVRDLLEYYFSAEPVVLIYMSPDNFKAVESELRAANATIIEDDSYVWWKRNDVAAGQTADEIITTDGGIYVPSGRYQGKSVQLSLGEIQTARLANGISVYFLPHKDEDSLDCTIRFALKGGVQHIARGEEGLENALFQVMARNSKKYKEARREKFAQKHDFYIECSSDELYSELAMSAGNAKDFYAALPVFADGILQPSFDSSYLEPLKMRISQYNANYYSDPNNFLTAQYIAALAENSGRAAYPGFLSADTSFITAEKLGALHSQILNASDMFIVAAGDLDLDELVKKLNKSLGKLPAAKSSFVPYAPYKIASAENVVFTHDSAAGTGIAYSFRTAPGRNSADYAPLLVATEIYSSVIYDVVREKYGACYTPSAFGGLFYLTECIFKISDFENFARYVSEAKEEMLSGAYISELLDGAKVSIEKDLEANWTSATVAANEVAFDIAYSDNPRWSEEIVKALKAVSEEDVRRVFSKYYIDSSARWFAVTGEAEKERISF